MRRKITWVRHGQSIWNAEGRWQGHSDVALSDLGEQQARALSARLSQRTFDAVFSSDLLRSQQTCRLALPGAEMKIDARLREINFGVYEGQTWSSMDESQSNAVKTWWDEPYKNKLEGGESMDCLNQRVVEFLEELPAECEVAIFTHGGVVRNAVWQVVGPPLKGQWTIVIDNTSLTTIEYLTGKIRLHQVNDVAHLDEMGPGQSPP